MKIGKFSIEADEGATPGRFIIYGPGSVGKSTLACSAPNPIIISCEDGTREFRVPTVKFDATGRVQPTSFVELLEAVNAIAAAPDVGDRQSLVLDGAHQIDELVKEEVCRQNPRWKSIQQEGFGKGEAEVLRVWRTLIAPLEAVNRKHKLRLVITSHAQITKFKDPEGPEYTRFDMAVTTHPKGDVAGFLFGWCEVFAFARFEKLTDEVGPEKSKRTIALADQGERLIHFKWTNSYQAKCRLSGAPQTMKLTHPDGTPKTWAEVFGVLEDKAPERMRGEIESLLVDVGADEMKQARAYMAKVGDDVPALSRMLEKLRNGKKQNEQQENAA